MRSGVRPFDRLVRSRIAVVVECAAAHGAQPGSGDRGLTLGHVPADADELAQPDDAERQDDTVRTRCLRHLLQATSADSSSRWPDALRALAAAITVSAARGAGMSVLYALPRLAYADLFVGHWATVREAADEALGLAPPSVSGPSARRRSPGSRCSLRCRVRTGTPCSRRSSTPSSGRTWAS